MDLQSVTLCSQCREILRKRQRIRFSETDKR